MTPFPELLKLSRMRPVRNIVIGAQRPRTDPVRGVLCISLCGSPGGTRSQLAATDAGVPYQAVPEGGLSEWTKEAFLRDDALIFVGACGIAVLVHCAIYGGINFRTLRWSVWMRRGQFVIPLLSGHVGGANPLAEMVASGIGAVPGGDDGDGCGEEICGGHVRKGSWICDHGPETCEGDFG